MPPTLKETVDSQNATSGPRPVPVCLEVPVTVRGVITDNQSNQTLSFTESTRTVLVFARGAVLRLAAAVTPGQTVILVNENTRKEVCCEVVKSKTYRGGNGVIELAFSERSDSFWAMSFPDEKPPRRGAQTGPAAPAPAPQNDLPLGVAPPVTNAYSGEAELAPIAETPTTPAAPAPEPVSAAPPAMPAVEPPPAVAPPAEEAESMPVWLENPGAISEPASVRFAKTPVAATGGSLGAKDGPRELTRPPEARKLQAAPALAEESASEALPDFLTLPSSTSRNVPEFVDPPRGRAGRTALLLRAGIAAMVALSLSGGAWYLWQLPGRASGAAPITENRPAAERPAQASVAGAESAAQPPLGTAPAPPVSAEGTGPAATGEARLTSETNYNPAFTAPRPVKKAAEDQGQPGFSLPVAARSATANPADAQNASAASAAAVFPSAEKQARLPIPAEADLATRAPAPSRSGPAHKLAGVSAEEADSPAGGASGIPGSLAPVTSAALQENLLAASKQPLPPGGQARPARLIASEAPVYPLAARAQRISGDVVVDAVIEASGKVGAMKIVSGHPLLQQGALAALRKWRYQPAILNGEAISTHLQVTIQFRFHN